MGYAQSMGSIYVLRDPRSGEIRYVGHTVGSLAARLVSHLSEARTSKEETYKLRWLRQLQSKHLKPTIHFVAATTINDWEDKERRAIAKARELGHPLTNTSPGGAGHYRFSPERVQRHAATALATWQAKSPAEQQAHIEKITCAIRSALAEKVAVAGRDAYWTSRGEKMSAGKARAKAARVAAGVDEKEHQREVAVKRQASEKQQAYWAAADEKTRQSHGERIIAGRERRAAELGITREEYERRRGVILRQKWAERKAKRNQP